MSRLSCNEMTTYRWSFEEDVLQYRKAGMGAIGVWRQKLSDFGEDRGIDLLHDSGLRVSNLLWAGGFTGSDGRTFREALEDAHDAIKLAAALHADCLVVYTGARAGHTHKHARRLANDALADLLPAAEEQNVTLAIEPMHVSYATDWTFLTELVDTLELLTTCDHSRLRLVFDTYHLGWESDILNRVLELTPWIGVVHLGDGRRGLGPEQERTRLGEGDVPLREMIHALENAGYTGFYDLELIGQDVENCDYVELLDHSRRVFEQITSEISV